MINFSKHLATGKPEQKLHPVEIYDSLDRRSDKGPLRPAQVAILTTWFEQRRQERDVIVKLHTGEGKTLTGLLMLQTQLNAQLGPAMYLCPNKYLAEQTQAQADKFGIKWCAIGEDRQIPPDFTNARSILITHVQKLFNGETKFGLGQRSAPIGAIVLDDSHACIESIRQAFTIRVTREHNPQVYAQLFAYFEDDLRQQSLARTEEIKAKEWGILLPVPYWTWQSRQEEIAALLTGHRLEKGIRYSWDLVKDNLRDCQAFITAHAIEIAPYHNPLRLIGSFDRAKLRVFMSATTNDDSFFVKELGLSSSTVTAPLSHEEALWSGEKMVLIPYSMDYHLTHQNIIDTFGPAVKGRSHGVVALVPSFNDGEIWKTTGAELLTNDTLSNQLNALKAGDGAKARVLVNRYDGIDLPDEACRILVLDGKPTAENLSDRYQEECREGSDVVVMKTAQKIEQGLGRGVRGEKDYCVILLVDHHLTSFVTNLQNQRFFSPQTRRQLYIGDRLSEIAMQEADSGDAGVELQGIIRQCLKRDPGWRAFYAQEMEATDTSVRDSRLLPILELERQAELSYQQDDIEGAIAKLQLIIDKHLESDNKAERGWYLQEMARLRSASDPTQAGHLQRQAHKLNPYLLKPQHGMQVSKLLISQTQAEGAITWLRQAGTFKTALLQLQSILVQLEFGVDAKKFEKALQELGTVLGFRSGRPEKEYGRGPDNLWNVAKGEYLLFECKNEVKPDRNSIIKTETGQMANSQQWFKQEYGDAHVTPVMIIPTVKVSRDAALSKEVVIMTKVGIRKLRENSLKYLQKFQKYNLAELTTEQVYAALHEHKLTSDALKTTYTLAAHQLV